MSGSDLLLVGKCWPKCQGDVGGVVLEGG